MEQLSELDYSMLQIETNRTPQHIAMVMFYDASTVEGGKLRYKDILTVFEGNLQKSPVFRRKLAGSTGGFDTPYWIEDRDFDLEFHVRHLALPAPGDWRQLCILVARLNSRGVDMGRPPWEVYVIEGLKEVDGLPPNSFAIMLKVHHAAVDGVSMAAMLGGIHSITNTRAPPAHDDWQGEPEPRALQVWARALRNNIRRPVRLVRAIRDAAPRLREARERAPVTEKRYRGVRTRFNAPVSPHRVVDALVMELDEVKAIRQAVEGITVNDVIIAIVGGGLRRYLEAKGELPDASLMASVPISVREENSPDARGNQIGMIRITLATDLEHPMERLRAIHESATENKEYARAMGVRNMLEFTEGMWPVVISAGFKLASRVSAKQGLRFPQQTIVSNVPGPQKPVYLAGAKLYSLLILGPISDGMGLFNGVISGGGKISITFVSCRKMMPDPEFYRECLQEAWNEIRDASRVGDVPKPRIVSRRKR